MNFPSFQIYDASAGSGKTHALVKAFLVRVIDSRHRDSYKNMLAITFTNKAVAEMKNRIVKTLVSFASEDFKNDPPEMMKQIAEEGDLTLEGIHTKSKEVLKHLLHNYGYLSVETIDHFNHRLIRTFARDLKLSTNFEVSLDTPKLISEAVDQLIAKAGVDDEITRVLLEFALLKTDDDRSWDISRDINAVGSLLNSETHLEYIKNLEDKSLHDFSEFQKKLRSKEHSLLKTIKSSASEVLEKLSSEGILEDVFSRNTLPNHFRKLQEGQFRGIYVNQLQANLEEGGHKLYKKTTPVMKADIADQLTPYLLEAYLQNKSRVSELGLLQNILKNIIPLSVIHLVQHELEKIKEEQNLLPISEFNSIINDEIKDQPAPFIYERLGDRYRHFFIDEFQDTSEIQWKNLIPLIDNALSQVDVNGEQGSLLLVGDAKQSIYRWRGGYPEQFIQLSDGANPFSIENKAIDTLGTNFRSKKKIVDFNNDFFSYVSALFENPQYEELYKRGNEQISKAESGGYVNISFIEAENKDEANFLYSERILQTIKELRQDGFQDKDICILVRSKKDGFELSNRLLENKIKVVSPDSLLLKNSELISIIFETLTLSIFPENEESKIRWLIFLYEIFEIDDPEHEFLNNYIKRPLEEISSKLEEMGIHFHFSEFLPLSLYESCEYIIRQLQLQDSSDAFLIEFMDLIHEFEKRPDSGKISFIEYWNEEMDKASASLSDNQNSIQLMTIHKAKGLQFPVVIFPYADVKLRDARGDYVWYPWNQDGFEEVLINYNQDLADTGDVGAEIYANKQSTLQLDALNMLYVCLTRPVERLYILGRYRGEKTGAPQNYSEVLIQYLIEKGLWNLAQLTYEIGSTEKYLSEVKSSDLKEAHITLICSTPTGSDLNIVVSDAALWENDLKEALDIGNRLHDLMANVKVESDLNRELENLNIRGQLIDAEKKLMTALGHQIVNHPELSPLFNGEDRVLNEQDILVKEGRTLRPDRLNLHADGTATLIDYKTGQPREEHEFQINGYAEAIEAMGYSVVKKLIVYTYENEISVNKV